MVKGVVYAPASTKSGCRGRISSAAPLLITVTSAARAANIELNEGYNVQEDEQDEQMEEQDYNEENEFEVEDITDQ